MVVHVDDAFMMAAAKRLHEVGTQSIPELKGVGFELFYQQLVSSSHPELRLRVLSEGAEHGMMTLEKRAENGQWVRAAKPVDCYNLVRPGEDLATAVQRVYGP